MSSKTLLLLMVAAIGGLYAMQLQNKSASTDGFRDTFEAVRASVANEFR